MTDDARDFAQLALLGEAVECLEDVAIFVWDEDRHYIAANDAACALVGLPREELLRMKVGDMTPGRATAQLEEVLHGAFHRGSLLVEATAGEVEIEWVTCRTRIAGLPYMVSLCWRKERP